MIWARAEEKREGRRREPRDDAFFYELRARALPSTPTRSARQAPPSPPLPPTNQPHGHKNGQKEARQQMQVACPGHYQLGSVPHVHVALDRDKQLRQRIFHCHVIGAAGVKGLAILDLGQLGPIQGLKLAAGEGRGRGSGSVHPP